VRAKERQEFTVHPISRLVLQPMTGILDLDLRNQAWLGFAQIGDPWPAWMEELAEPIGLSPDVQAPLRDRGILECRRKGEGLRQCPIIVQPAAKTASLESTDGVQNISGIGP